MELKNRFRFVHEMLPAEEYMAVVDGGLVVVSWNWGSDGGGVTTYTTFDAEAYIAEGIWIVR